MTRSQEIQKPMKTGESSLSGSGKLTYRKVEDGELSYEDLERLHPTIQQAVEIALNLYMESQQEAAREATETQ